MFDTGDVGTIAARGLPRDSASWTAKALVRDGRMVSVSSLSPLPVQIISHENVWTWLAPPLITFGSSVVLFFGTLFTLWRSIRANSAQLDKQLEAARTEKVNERAAAHADQFRDEVASILAERQSLRQAQAYAAFAVARWRGYSASDDETTDDTPIDDKWFENQETEATKFMDSRNKYLTEFNRFEQLVIRASLFTNDAEAIAVLDKLRKLLEQSKQLFNTPEEKNPQDEAHELIKQVGTTFKELENCTRRMSTALSSAAPEGGDGGHEVIGVIH
jgi:hypothetical protein